MIEVRLPALGADMVDGTLLQWQVKPGDAVARGQVVAVVDTDKAAVEVESWDEGRVHELLLAEGDKVPVGTPMLSLLEPGEMPELTAAQAARRPALQAEPPPTPPAGSTARPRITPAARRRAEALGVDAARLQGTGPDGAISLADVEAAAQGQGADTEARPADEDKSAAMRRIIAQAMSRSKREIPHFYLTETIALSRAMAWLTAWNAEHALSERLLPAALLLKATALALGDFPELNGHWREGGFVAAPRVHLGIAIALRQGGLVAPALRDAATLPLPRLMAGLMDLVQRARGGSLRSGELSEGTLTVSQLGEQGAESVLGVIYPPQVALVGFGRIAERPWVEEGRLVVSPTVVASLAADHRVSDGHRAGRFLANLRERLQAPESL